MLLFIQEDVDLGMLGPCAAEITFWWHPGQKEIITADPAYSQEGIKPHSEGIAKVSLLSFPVFEACTDLDITAFVKDSEYATKEIEDVIAYIMKESPEDAELVPADEWAEYET